MSQRYSSASGPKCSLPSAGQRSLCGDQRGWLEAWIFLISSPVRGEYQSDSQRRILPQLGHRGLLRPLKPVNLASAHVSSEKLKMQGAAGWALGMGGLCHPGQVFAFTCPLAAGSGQLLSGKMAGSVWGPTTKCSWLLFLPVPTMPPASLSPHRAHVSHCTT